MQEVLNRFSKLSAEEKKAALKDNKRFALKMQSSAPVTLPLQSN